jgi:LPXTG-motif cell wall-anchored protein
MIRRIQLLFLMVVFSVSVFGQTVSEIDTQNDPVDFTDPANFIALIVIPLLILALSALLIWKRRKHKKNEHI